MAGKTYPVIQKRLELRSKALAANRAELSHLEGTLVKIDGVLVELKDLTAQQASLSAAKQEVSKRIAERMREGEALMAFVDAGVRQHYGNRSEKLVEFGLQPFRPQPRIRLVGPDGETVKRSSEKVEPPVPPESR
jgi:hypothetical protein